MTKQIQAVETSKFIFEVKSSQDLNSVICGIALIDGVENVRDITEESAKAQQEAVDREREKFRDEVKALYHFHDTNIGLLATDKTYEDFRMIIYEAIEAAFDMSGIGKPTADVSLPVILSAQEKLKKIMWMIEPIKVKALKKEQENI